MNRKSPSCKSGKTGRPLTEYDTKTEAKSGARYVSETFGGQDLIPYKCKQCGFWHLSPADRQTPSTTCPICRGADGKQKEAYHTERDALRRAGHLRKEQGVKLKVYQCEHGHGWHLTKRAIG